jgi:hypothetical protein
MYSKKKDVRPVKKKKPINWTYVAFIIFCIVMVIGFIVTAIT